jgi:hypothetical protein
MQVPSSGVDTRGKTLHTYKMFFLKAPVDCEAHAGCGLLFWGQEYDLNGTFVMVRRTADHQ